MMNCDGGNPNTICAFDNNSTIHYEGTWILNTTNPGKNPQTNHITSTNGSTISYRFNGTQIKVVGAKPFGKGLLIANYTIDNGEPQTGTIDALLQNTPDPFATLFSSETLDMSEHTIFVEVLGTGVDRNYTFNQFQVTAPANGTKMNVNMNGSGGMDGSGDGSGSGNGSSNSGETKVNPNTTAIVGGILGSVIFLILIIFGIFLFWRRRRLARISNGGQNHLPPMMFYAQSMPDGTPRGQEPYAAGPGSYVDTDSKFTFPVNRRVADGSRRSWVSINAPPSIPESAIVNDLPISDWSSYKGSSVIIQQSHGEQSRFSPYTTTTISPMAFRGQTPPAPRRAVRPPPLQIDALTRTSKSSLVRDGEAF